MEYSQKNPNPGQGNHAIRFSNVFIKLMHLADRYCKSGLSHNDETVMTAALQNLLNTHYSRLGDWEQMNILNSFERIISLMKTQTFELDMLGEIAAGYSPLPKPQRPPKSRE